jgi:hypothetical protein
VTGQPASPYEAVQTAIAGVHAYDSGQHLEVLQMGAADPAGAFGGAVALASRLADEVRKLGGDPEVIMDRIFCKAYDLAL